jgi:hypothetical protein
MGRSRAYNALMRVHLHVHPSTPSDSIESLSVAVERRNEATLAIRYIVIGDMTRLALPPPASPRRADELWRHTCFELFARQSGRQAYYEFNFSPAGPWAAYAFDDYRSGMTELSLMNAPRVSSLLESNRLEVEAHIEIPLEDRSSDAFEFALAAVIEDRQDGLSYWALAHPKTKPDFHHADGFTLPIHLEGRS